MLFVASKSVKIVVVDEVVDTAEVAMADEVIATAVDTVEAVKVEEILDVMVVVKAADTKVTVIALVEAETVEILALQEAIEGIPAILLLKRVVHVREVLNHVLLVHPEVMLQEHLALKVLLVQSRLQEMPIKKRVEKTK